MTHWRAQVTMGCYAPLSRSVLRLDAVLGSNLMERLLVGPRHAAVFCCGQASVLAKGRLLHRRPALLLRRTLFDPDPVSRLVSQRRLFSSKEPDKQGLHTGRLHKDNLLKDVIQMKKDSLLEREKKLRATGQNILSDIRETKDKMRERMENVIEVCLFFCILQIKLYFCHTRVFH